MSLSPRLSVVDDERHAPRARRREEHERIVEQARGAGLSRSRAVDLVIS
jgi:hypothetical protein